MARVIYGPIDRERIRVIREGFGWIDHRFVRGRFIDGRSPEGLSLYPFLVTVADADGVSFWSDKAMCERLPLSPGELMVCRQELVDAELIAYERPVWQVLQLPGGAE